MQDRPPANNALWKRRQELPWKTPKCVSHFPHSSGDGSIFQLSFQRRLPEWSARDHHEPLAELLNGAVFGPLHFPLCQVLAKPIRDVSYRLPTTSPSETLCTLGYGGASYP